MRAPNVLGLDLALNSTGVAHVDGTLSTLRSKGDGDARLLDLSVAVVNLLAVERVDLAVVEDLPTHAHSAGLTGMAHGVVRVALQARGVPYALVPPATLKKYATGRGNATKADMRVELLKRADLDVRNDDEVDAYWLRALGLDSCGAAPLALPEAHRAMLRRVAWPALA